MTAMRIAYVVRSWPRLSQTFVRNEISALEALGVDIEIFSLSRPDEPLAERDAASVRAPVHYLDAGVSAPAHARVLRAGPRRYLATLAYVAAHPRLTEGYGSISPLGAFDAAVRVAAAGCPDRIHAHFAHDPGLVAMLAHRLTGIPFGITAHARDLYGIPRPALAARVAEADVVVTCCRANVEHLAPVVDGSRLHLVHHGVDVDVFRPADGSAGGAPPLLLSVGRLVEKKGFPDLLRALAVLRASGRRFRCEIHGDGPLRADLERLRDDLGLGDCVAFCGASAHGDLVGVFQSADAFALLPFVAADGDRDGVPNVLVEAMACGLPVLTTPVGGITDLVDDGDNGLLVPARDPAAAAARLSELLDDGQLRTRLGRAARRTVEDRFDASVAARRLADLFGAVGAGAS